ncbi:MAG: ATP-dependent Clp protease adapter ClpS, partial [Acinetobacter sp.]
MRMNKRQNCLNDIKNSFHQSGYVDWHISPRLSNETHEEAEGDIAVQAAKPELKRPPM